LQYIFSLLLFVANNKDQCKINYEIHSVSTRPTPALHQPLSNLTRDPLFLDQDF